MGFAELWRVVCLSTASIVALFALTKILGNRQMSQLTMFDYIAGISIGSIAAEMALRQEGNGWLGLVAMAVYAGFTLLLNWLDSKSVHLRRVLLGEPLVLYEQGTLYFNNLKKARLDLTEFLTECRNGGYFDLAKLHMVILEVNGKFSFLPVEAERPATPRDMQLPVKQQRPVINVIVDGKIQHGGLQATGNDEAWLGKQLQLQGFSTEKDIFLGTVDTENQLVLYEKNEDRQSTPYYS